MTLVQPALELFRQGEGEPSDVTGQADAEPGLERVRYDFYSFSAVFAEVGAAEETGVVQVARLCGVYDRGRLIIPGTARSQPIGGTLFGLGAPGVGKMGTDGVPAVVGNATFGATGERLRPLPYTSDKLIEA